MQVFGDERKLKEFIKDKYDSKIKELDSEYQEKIREAEAQIEEKIEEKKRALDAETQKEITQAKSKTLSEERLKAKQNFEKTREKLITETLEQVEDGLMAQAHSKEYLEYLKNKTKGLKDFEVIADSDYYKKVFPKYKKDNSIIGVKLLSGELTYDLTLSTAFNAKKELLRQKASETLFS